MTSDEIEGKDFIQRQEPRDFKVTCHGRQAKIQRDANFLMPTVSYQLVSAFMAVHTTRNNLQSSMYSYAMRHVERWTIQYAEASQQHVRSEGGNCSSGRLKRHLAGDKVLGATPFQIPALVKRVT